MIQIHPYLTFNGNCREAMHFYQKCLGGELYFQTVGETPLTEDLPATMKKYIVHATLTKETFQISASDMVEEKGIIKGNTISLMIQCSTEEEIRVYYRNLLEGGQGTHPLEKTFWGALFGGLTDKYGNQWLLNFLQS